MSEIPVWKLTALLVILSIAACSTYHYKDYQADWAPDKMVPYDLSNNMPDAPVVYFATVRFHAVGIPFHRLLLATHVDGNPIKGAGRHSAREVSGEQALRLTPGKHSLRWCWVSMNGLGTGGAKCGLEARDVEFREGQRYVVDFPVHTDLEATTVREGTEEKTGAVIRNLDTNEVIYPSLGVAPIKE